MCNRTRVKKTLCAIDNSKASAAAVIRLPLIEEIEKAYSGFADRDRYYDQGFILTRASYNM